MAKLGVINCQGDGELTALPGTTVSMSIYIERVMDLASYDVAVDYARADTTPAMMISIMMIKRIRRLLVMFIGKPMGRVSAQQAGQSCRQSCIQRRDDCQFPPGRLPVAKKSIG